MECPICLSETDEFVVCTRCFHGACKKCRDRLHGSPCYYCRNPSNGVSFECMTEDYVDFVINEDRSSVHPFDVLLTSKYKRSYEIFRDMIHKKWSSVSEYTFEKVCLVCTLTQKYPEIDITLFSLFYSCSTITRTTIMDILTCLSMVYGIRACSDVSPKDVYFHFFLNHCSTGRSTSEDDQSGVCDFVTSVMHALIYDVPEVDSVANFINILPSDAYLQCKCNSAQTALATIYGKLEDTASCDSGVDDGMHPFEPEGQFSSEERICWDNSYKWSTLTKEKDDCDVDESKVDCLSVFSDCRICNRMMDHSAFHGLNEIDGLIQTRRKHMNIDTAVTVVCVERKHTDKSFITDMINHYTDTQCQLNRLKFIYFYSLVKQPSSLMNGTATQHLYKELFGNKQSYLCPIYHLACFSDCIVKADSSQLKKTKRDSIQKWASKVIRRHIQTASII